jgi:hypothetical protein
MQLMPLSPRKLKCALLHFADSRHRTMAWTARPTNLLLIQKVNDERTRIAMSKILK